MELELERTSLDGLTDEVKKLYVEKDGKFTLDAAAALKYTTSQIEDQTGLKRNYERMGEDLKKLRAQLKQFEDDKKAAEEAAKRAAEEKELEKQRKDNDFDGYKQSVEKKHQSEIDVLVSKVKSHEQTIERLTVDATAISLASELAVGGSEKLLVPLVKSRLRTKYGEDGNATVEVLDELGRPTAFTVEDLKKQIASDPSCARIVRGSDASGAGHQSSPSTTTVTPPGGATGAGERAPGAHKKYETDAEFAERQARRIEELNKKNGGG